jgi:hypothetical protein
MRWIYLFLALLLAVVVLPAVVRGQETTDFYVAEVVWGDGVQTEQVGPGTINALLTIKLIYKSGTPLSYGAVTILLPEGFAGLDGSQTVTKYIGALQQGQQIALTYRINVGEKLPFGTYTATLRLEGTKSDDTTFHQTTSIKIKLLGEVKVEADIEEKLLVAGKRNVVELKLSNIGTGAASKVEVVMTAPAGISILTNKAQLDQLQTGSPVTIPFTVYVSPNTGGSAGHFTVTVSYYDPYGERRQESFQIGFEVGYPSSPNIALEVTPNTLTMLNVNTIVLKITNLGSAGVTDISLQTSVNTPLILLGSDGKFNVKKLGPREESSIMLSLYVSETAAPSAQFSVTLSYIDDSNQLRTETRVLTLFITARSQELLSPIDVRLSPSELKSGMINNVTITLRNRGTSPLRAVSVSMTSSASATWLEEGLVQVGDLTPGQETRLVNSLFIPSDSPTSIAIPLTITYYGQDNIQKTENRQVGALVRGVITFELVSYTILPERPAPGQPFSVTIVLVNTGTVKAASTSVTLTPDRQFRSFGQSRTFLGDVAVNTPTSVTFSLTLGNATQPGIVRLPLTITYRDNLGANHSAELTVPIPVGPAQQTRTFQTAAGQQPNQFPITTIVTYIVFLAVGLAAGLFVGRRWRR